MKSGDLPRRKTIGPRKITVIVTTQSDDDMVSLSCTSLSSIPESDAKNDKQKQRRATQFKGKTLHLGMVNLNLSPPKGSNSNPMYKKA
jgi:hypothetical protein